MLKCVCEYSKDLDTAECARVTITQAQRELERRAQGVGPLGARPGLQEKAEKCKKFLEDRRLQSEWAPSPKRAIDASNPVKAAFKRHLERLAEVRLHAADLTRMETAAAAVEAQEDQNRRSEVDCTASVDQTNETAVNSSQQHADFPANHGAQLPGTPSPPLEPYQTMFTLAMKAAVQFWPNALLLPTTEPLGELASQIYTVSPEHFIVPNE
jgi:hypothetical protein